MAMCFSSWDEEGAYVVLATKNVQYVAVVTVAVLQQCVKTCSPLQAKDNLSKD